MFYLKTGKIEKSCLAGMNSSINSMKSSVHSSKFIPMSVIIDNVIHFSGRQYMSTLRKHMKIIVGDDEFMLVGYDFSILPIFR